MRVSWETPVPQGSTAQRGTRRKGRGEESEAGAPAPLGRWLRWTARLAAHQRSPVSGSFRLVGPNQPMRISVRLVRSAAGAVVAEGGLAEAEEGRRRSVGGGSGRRLARRRTSSKADSRRPRSEEKPKTGLDDAPARLLREFGFERSDLGFRISDFKRRAYELRSFRARLLALARAVCSMTLPRGMPRSSRE